MPPLLGKTIRHLWTIVYLTVKRFLKMDGAQWAGAFAHYAFFSLFPLIILFVTIASVFIDRDQAGATLISYLKTYVPVTGDMQNYFFDTIDGVVAARGEAGIIAFLILIWVSMQFFTTLTSATNLAWEKPSHSGWRVPLKSLIFLALMGSALLLGLAIPVLAKVAKEWLSPEMDFNLWVYAVGRFLLPLLVVFLSLSLFYKLAPVRTTRFIEVWIPALGATFLLLIAQSLFMIYLRNFDALNPVYGIFGGIMALLLWIYLSGCIFIFGACLCAVRAESRPAPAEMMVATRQTR
ncbi:MAG: hypothetical protein A2293_08610 [Elusimicrobia bacterium RIFOXYB2_FULL_49_7]|nr:MAG: hypothetical protein A2293_08610 [Elusimicrobia bacterium RIFOXYB2_FULL_49_7]